MIVTNRLQTSKLIRIDISQSALHTDVLDDTFACMARNKPTSPRASGKAKTIQRTYRFDTKLFDTFEDDCARHLSNPKRVIEAAIIHWLGANPETRATMAQKHREQIAYGQQDD